MSAGFLSQVDPSTGASEDSISRILQADGLYEEGMGTGLYPADTLDHSARQFGLTVSEVYGGRVAEENEEARVVERLARISQAVERGESVMLAFPKRREGQFPFLHYVVVTGFQEDKKGNGVVIVDPSDVDGGVIRPSWEELKDYVTAGEGYPVMAWGISRIGEAPVERRTEVTSGKGLPGFDLLADPIYKPEDIGRAIPPDTEHPSSTAMTTSEISRQYNELGGLVLSRDGEQPIGYPRFVVPPAIKELSLATTGHLTNLPFPTWKAAKASAHLVETYSGFQTNRLKGKELITEQGGVFWLSDDKFATDAWQHIGLGVSSRQATAIMEGRPENDLERRAAAEQKIKGVIETHTGADPEDVYLFSTGMAGIYWLNQALIKMGGDAPSVQFGFPYTDTYEHRKYGPHKNPGTNILDFRDGDYTRLRHSVSDGQKLRGVITEYPTNPLLWTPNLERLEGAVGGETPIVVDDTVGTMFNLDDKKLPDSVAARATSLTKFFSSVGDAMGGAVVLRRQSPHYEELKAAMDELYEDTLWYEDAEKLAENSELFPAVMEGVNANGRTLTRWLNEEWTGEDKPLQTVYHPSLNAKRAYNSLKKLGGGYGGLFSLRFNDPERAYNFFDALRVTKGPSLGTFYTLGCLYTYLAHKPLGSVERFGVTPDLVRISVGIEEVDDLQDRFAEAFKAVT
jgi:cystathionine gamma-synthase